MQRTLTETLVGFIVIIIAAVFLMFAFNKASISTNNDSYTVKARFENVDGIVNGSDIMLAGVKVGDVEGLELDNSTFMANLTLRFNKDIKLPKDSQAVITTSGILGGKFISIIPGGDDEELVAGDQIQHTQSSINIESLISKLMYSFTNK